MKQCLTVIATLLITAISFAQNKKNISIVVSSSELSPKSVRIIEDDFEQFLLKGDYNVRIGKSGDLFDARNDELRYQQSGAVDEHQIKQFGNQMGADLLCVVVVVKINSEYAFRATIFNVENGQIDKISKYPDILNPLNAKPDRPVKEIDLSTLQLIDAYLIFRLDILDNNNRMILQNQLKKIQDAYEQWLVSSRIEQRKVNTKALKYSIIPGLGLMMKGHKSEGAVYLLGNVMLVGGGISMFTYANRQKNIMNDRNSNYEQFTIARNNYNKAKTIGYCCFGAAAVLYGVNLIRSYIAPPKQGARLTWNIAPFRYSDTLHGNKLSDMSVNLAFTYRF